MNNKSKRFILRVGNDAWTINRPARKEWAAIYDSINNPPFSRNAECLRRLAELLGCEFQEVGKRLKALARKHYDPWERKVPEVVFRVLSGELVDHPMFKGKKEKII